MEEIIKLQDSENHNGHNKHVKVLDRSSAEVGGNSILYAYDYSVVGAFDNSEVHAYNKSEIYATNNSKVYANDDSVVEAYENTIVFAYDNSVIGVYDNAIVHKMSSTATINIKGENVKVIDHTED